MSYSHYPYKNSLLQHIRRRLPRLSGDIIGLVSGTVTFLSIGYIYFFVFFTWALSAVPDNNEWSQLIKVGIGIVLLLTTGSMTLVLALFISMIVGAVLSAIFS